MNLKILRRLARSNQYQILYNRAKEMGSIRLFNNKSDLSSAQLYFLQLLELYSSLYHDIALDKNYIDEEVIKDDLRMEAYLLLRRMTKKDKKDSASTKKREIITSGEVPSVIFKRK